MGNYVYHCSKREISVFDPEKSKGEKVVYATPFKWASFIFGIEKHGDHLLRADSSLGRTLLIEMQPNAIEEEYNGQKAYLYTFDSDDFPGRTHWIGEVTSNKSVKPKTVTIIHDLGKELLKSQKADGVEFLRFNDRNKYFNADEIVSAGYMKKLLSPNIPEHIKLLYLGWLDGLKTNGIYNSLKSGLNIFLSDLEQKKNSQSNKGEKNPEKILVEALDLAHEKGYKKALNVFEGVSEQEAQIMAEHLKHLRALVKKREKNYVNPKDCIYDGH